MGNNHPFQTNPRVELLKRKSTVFAKGGRDRLELLVAILLLPGVRLTKQN